MAKRIIEKMVEGLGAFGGIHGLLETLGKVNTILPEEIKRKLPGFLGASSVDEAITNGLIRSLKKKDENLEETKEPDIEKQAIIFKFLDEKCKSFERRLFIMTVAEMEVSEAKSPIPGCDRRREFLDVFGTVLLSFNDFDLAYKECVAGRMILPDPIHQKALRAFSESAGWFKKTALDTFGAKSIEDLIKKAKEGFSKNSANLESSTSSLREKAKSYREKYDKKYAGRNKP